MAEEEKQSSDNEEREQEYEKAKEEIQQLEEEGPPDALEDWPGGKAKYETFGGPEGDHAYDEGPEEKLGPSSLRHHDDGSVTVEGEEVDDPDEYKGEPIPGGPTDPDTPNPASDKTEEDEDGEESGDDADSGDADSDDSDKSDSDSGDSN